MNDQMVCPNGVVVGDFPTKKSKTTTCAFINVVAQTGWLIGLTVLLIGALLFLHPQFGLYLEQLGG